MKRLLLPLVAALGLPVQAEVDSEIHKMCLEARDYSGCVKSQDPSKNKSSERTLDALGLEMIPGYEYKTNQSRTQTFHYGINQAKQVEVRGMYGRYIIYPSVWRFYQSPTAGTAGYYKTIGSSKTNCTDMGWGSINCTTTPAQQIWMPGKAATAGGLRSRSLQHIIDCHDQTSKPIDGVTQYEWTSIEGTMDSKVARKWCGSVLELPYSSYPIYRRGTPNSSDIAALEILVKKSMNPAFLKCEKDFLVDCVKRLQNNAIAINSIQKTSKGYLIDLGADSSLWQEGLFWKERGCKVNKKGGSKTRDMTDGNGFTQRYRWFRQGWCKDQTIYGSK